MQLGSGRRDGDGANVIAFDPTTGELRGIATGSRTEIRWQRINGIVSARVTSVGDLP